MPHFTIVTPPLLRFDGDFQIGPSPDQNHQSSSEETQYIATVKQALDQLTEDESADSAAGYPVTLLASRRAARQAAVADLKADAQRVANDDTVSQEATQSPIDVMKKYRGSIPRFGTKDSTPARFEGDFDIVSASNHLTPAEHEYLKRLKTALDEFAADEKGDPDAKYSQQVLAARKARRSDVASRLRSDADKFCKGDTNAESAADDVLVSKGMYRALRDRLTRRLFNVTILTGDEKHKKPEDLGFDLRIATVSGLPAPEDTVSPEKQDLFVQINKTATVIRTVCYRMQASAEHGWAKSRGSALAARVLLDEYISRLRGIAVIGLENSHTALAKLALAELRNEFVAQEAGRIKNKYARHLGAWAALAMVAFLTTYVVVAHTPTWNWGQVHRAFLLAAAGAAVGTWVSFSIRQVQLSFDDLVMLEEDSLDPPLRVAFVIAMTLTACLLFWTGAINIEIGLLKTRAEDAFTARGSIALLLGVFAGLSERALATAISGRAAAFVKGIGG